MNFQTNTGEVITLQEASEMTKRFRESTWNTGTIALAAGGDLVSQILSQTGCKGVRMYFALDADNQIQLVMVGVDENGDDMYEGVLVDRFRGCPPTCPSKNPLNDIG
ncbi:MAG: hypothetical protein RL106_1362 [Bacteroidota bacterium]|jgi:hypothetical protein